MKRLLSVLGGAVIAAAFLGPGTVTTAARAGAAHGLELLWTLVFATVACLVLQEASARLTIVSGLTLGAALQRRFGGGGARVLLWLVVAAILIGCAAYEAGNILGGVAGAALATEGPRWLLTLVSIIAAALLLGFGSTRQVVTVLSLLVALMGAGFVATAVLLAPSLEALLAGLLLPRVPTGAGLLVLGLIGTTVVPYNLFLGSGMARGERLGELRFGLAVAIGLGGIISMAVVVVGSAMTGTFGYQELALLLAERLGAWAAPVFGLGLFAAGFSSAITAPLAAAITARSLFAADADDRRWGDRSLRYRAVWAAVLAIGAIFGLSEVRPIPVILLAQALNGLLLPVVAIFLLVAVNDRRLVGSAGLNGWLSNTVTALVVMVTVLLGLRGMANAVAATLGRQPPGESFLVGVSAVAILLLAWPVGGWLRAGRSADEPQPPTARS